MEVIRYKYSFALLTIILKLVANEATNTTTNCPFTRFIEDIFKIHNKTSEAGIYIKDNEKAKLFLNTIVNITSEDKNYNNTVQEELVNNIIASINRIKSNITTDKTNDTKLNEAIIINVPKENNKNQIKSKDADGTKKHIFQIKSGMEEKVDQPKQNNAGKETLSDKSEENKDKTTYVEILTIEPNNTNSNNSSSNDILEVLKHLMPMFNNSLYKELHNITIIERNHNKNHTFSATRNISTIVVTFCDKENFTKANVSFDSRETDIKQANSTVNENPDYEYPIESILETEEYDEVLDRNLTAVEKKDILEATKYGMRKMNELYSVLEPKLYSMGLWLDDSSPARYVAAFNAPSEDADRFARYGYAALYATAKLKQLSGNSDGLEGRTEESRAQFPTASALRQSPLLSHCPLKGAPKCPPASKRYRTHDGTCNNMNRPRWGSTMTPVQRFLPPSYSDGIQAPRLSVFGSPLPSAREVSSFIHEDQHVESPGITHLLMQWGQFLDHDVTSSSQTRGFNGSVPRCCKDGGRDFVPKDLLHPECMPIIVPSSDPFYGPRGVRCLDFVRSSPAPRDDCSLGWREQLNQVSAYIDGSPLYASSARQSDKLRLFRNGMLQYGRVQQRRPLLPPERKDELCRGGAVSTDCFKSGDARVNEHPGLVAAHIVWLRQHNRMAQELAHLNPHWSDEKIYQETRKIIGAMIQHITYREFLPVILGTEVMRLFELEPQKKGYFQGYDPKINPSPASSFGSAAFRFGHSLVQPSLMRYDRFHRPMNNNVSLHEEVSNPSNIWSMGAVDRLLLGMINQPIQKRDEFITEELTNHLFQTPKFDFGMDLGAINIQRGRDHGIAAYTAWREPCGLSAITDFEDLLRVMPARVVRKLQTLYRSVEDIDLFTGGMAERPVVGGLVGPTFACIIAQQFSNLRKGDRFWYENGDLESSFTPAQLQQIRRISFAQVICNTLDHIDNIQPFAFLSPEHPENERISCRSGPLNDFDLAPWVEIKPDLNNDISKSDDEPISTKKPSTQRPKRKPTTTTLRPTTKKNQKLSEVISNKVSQKKTTVSTPNKPTDRPDKNADKKNDNDSFTLNLDKIKINLTIDDKLDFKNKTRRYNDDDSHSRYNYKKPTYHYNDDYDDEDNVQSVQSVVINNVHNKRPYNSYNNNRPVMTVTENIDKYTYLINYVPRPTESWRQTTRRNTNYDRDVVKVTYQTYDDTYRRPNIPYYYNRHDNDDDNYYYRRDRPTDTTKDFQSSARSNDETITTDKPKTTIEKIDKPGSTTENTFKLVTFGYVGTYKNIYDVNSKTDKPGSKEKLDTFSKDFSTFSNANSEDNDKTNTMKLSTFFHYETVTKPYNAQRRNDEEQSTKNKYYYIKNVLHKYSEYDPTLTGQTDDKQELVQNNDNHPEETLKERAAVDKLAFLEEEEKAASPGKLQNKIRQPNKPAKTPSVAFQVIPSENNPSQWAVFDEVADLPEGFHQMPVINTDPQALREIPRPMLLNQLRFRLRRPGQF